MYKLDPVPLLFEESKPGLAEAILPASDVPQRPLDELIPGAYRSNAPSPLPELGELDVVRHYTNLSVSNMAIDANFYPLGSCTMKYNPKRNERLAGLPGMAGLHPYQPESTLQGILQLLHELQHDLAEIAGLDAVSLQPAAGAQGELAALLVAAASFRDKGEKRTRVLIPDSAHGTNPASAHLAGFEAVTIMSNARGFVDLDDFRAKLDDRTAVFMITNPNTVGLFDHQVGTIADLLHERGALLYLDGANMNAILGAVRPGDMGVDLMHYNPHKTFSGPHGGGGPGAGPIAVREHLAPYLPAPLVARRDDGTYFLDDDRPKSIGRIRSFFGNTGVLVRAYCYIRTHGPDGLAAVAQHAVLNANYLLQLVKDTYPVPHGDRCMHEFVASARSLMRDRGIRAMDVAKRLLDHNMHAPTVYFPLIVPEALMIEPTETESRATLERFAEALKDIAAEDPEMLRLAPHTTPISRPDEVAAARTPILTWKPEPAHDADDARPAASRRLRTEPHLNHPYRPGLSMLCRVLPHLVLDGPSQMAIDEALLDLTSAEPDAAAFRTYGWSEPTLSLGYFQSRREVEADARWLGVPLVRRPTGGGAIWHDREITYAIVLPRSHPSGRRVADLYRAVHGAIAGLLTDEGSPAGRRGEPSAFPQNRPFLCFTDRDPEDIVIGSVKVVGSAQRRRPGAVLQHGSILLAQSERTPELPGLRELSARDVEAAGWTDRLAARICEALDLTPSPEALSSQLEERATRLARDVYRNPAWTSKR